MGCSHPRRHWRFGNTIDGAQAEYLLVPDAMANLAPVPDGLTDEQVLMCPDIMSTGFSGAESGGVASGSTASGGAATVGAVSGGTSSGGLPFARSEAGGVGGKVVLSAPYSYDTAPIE